MTTTEISINGRVMVGVSRAEYRRLTEGSSATAERLSGYLESARLAHADVVKVRDELKRSLDDALSAVQRLSDERDEWKARAELGEKTLAKYPLRVMLGGQEIRDGRVWTGADHLAAEVVEGVDELRATIVRQASEITALKGETA